MKRLTAKQERFVAEYLIDLNATQAAIRAGYSERTAASIGAENLTKPEIAEAIEAHRKQALEEAEVTREWIIQSLVDSYDAAKTAEPPQCHAALKALELLGKHLGMFRGQAENSSEVRIERIERIIIDPIADPDRRGIPAPITAPKAFGHA